ncbi:MAG TPA: MmcQ/YjbR family DNA-binding protein [Fodinibius sp.]|nr:MmcQ/YjbR family DNA-binding protein [Fodinibius sp.]
MNLKEFKKFCLSFDGVTENRPFDDENILAFNVMDKVFALTNTEDFNSINMKCDPVKASMLRNLYEEVQTGEFLDKRHWNAVVPDGELDDELIKEWIKDSYNIIVEDLPRKKQKKLEKMSKN